MQPLEIVYKALDEVQADDPNAATLIKSPDTILLGEQGGIDSLMLVNLVVAIEQAVFDETGRSISVADEAMLSMEENPFRTIGSLAAYLETVLA